MAQFDDSMETLASVPKPLPAAPAQQAAVNPVTPSVNSISGEPVKPVATTPTKKIINKRPKSQTPKGKIVIFQTVTGKKAATRKNVGKKTVRKNVKKTTVKVPPKHVKKHIHKTIKTIRKLPVKKQRSYSNKLVKATAKKYRAYVKKAVVSVGVKLDKEVNGDAKKLGKLEKLLGDKKKKNKRSAGKKSAKKSGKKSGKKTGKKSAGKKSGKKAVARKPKNINKPSSGSADLKNVFNAVFNPSAFVQPPPQKKAVNKKKALKLVFKNLVNKGSLRFGRKGKCGGKVRIAFSGETSLKIGNVRL